MDPTTATILVALIGTIGSVVVAIINNRPKDVQGRQSIDPMWKIIAAIIVIAAAVWLLARVIVGALIDNRYSITGLVVAGAVFAIGVVLLKRRKPPHSN
jgi:hypothetical protein